VVAQVEFRIRQPITLVAKDQSNRPAIALRNGSGKDVHRNIILAPLARPPGKTGHQRVRFKRGGECLVPCSGFVYAERMQRVGSDFDIIMRRAPCQSQARKAHGLDGAACGPDIHRALDAAQYDGQYITGRFVTHGCGLQCTFHEQSAIVKASMMHAIDGTDQKPLGGLRALVVGGTGGIGLATARALASDGASLIIHGHVQERLESQAAALRNLGTDVMTVCADLASGDPPAVLLEHARAADLLVMAYGPFVNKSLAETTTADWRLIAMGGLALPGIVATAAAQGMASRGFGRILLFGGTRTDAIRGFKTNAAYAAAKTGLGVLAKSIAVEFGGAGVSCAVVCPGFVDTEYLDAPMRQRLTLTSPRGGLIPVAEIAGLAISLLEGQMDLANGSIIVADRGLYAL